jgi:hypothetical protein
VELNLRHVSRMTHFGLGVEPSSSLILGTFVAASWHDDFNGFLDGLRKRHPLNEMSAQRATSDVSW